MRLPLPNPTPRELGYHMPAEWHPHEGTWFSWPQNPDTWIHHLPAAERELAEAVKWLSTGETVHVNVLNADHEKHVTEVFRKAGVDGSIKFHHFPTNDSWCRDHGAIFLVHPDKPGYAACDWGYNAWGEKYPPFDLDNDIPSRMCEAMQAVHFQTSVTMEGGSIEVDGAGVLMTTEPCLLNPNRNPNLTKAQIETMLREMLGVERIIWLGGELVGDDTDGHIDNLARFANETTIIAPEERNESDPNYASLQANLGILASLKTTNGAPYDIVHLPMPSPYYLDGVRLPANYVNFYIGNEVVLMPAFSDPHDDIAANILQTCFPDRRVVPVDCRTIIWGLGALHCLSQQVPLPLALAGRRTPSI